MSFRLKPSYFEGDGPVCTRSASNFFRNPLNFLADAMWVKWWYHALYQPFSEFICSAFQFQGHLAQNKLLNAWKLANEVRKCWILGSGFKWCILNAQKVWGKNKFKKMKCLCNNWVFVWNPHTSKQMVQFVHIVHLVFATTLSTF